MKPKGLGKICFLLSDLSQQNEMFINLINRQAKLASKISVIVKDDIFKDAQLRFSKKVNLHNASMAKTTKGKKVVRYMLKAIKPNIIFVCSNDFHTTDFADYAGVKTMQIKSGDRCFATKKTVFITDDVQKSSEFIISFLEKKFSLDFYPKHYIQKKALLAQMKPIELLKCIFARKSRVEQAFQKEWGYKLPQIPQTYNEKINYEKLNLKNKKYRKYVDKKRVRKYINKLGYGELLPKCFAFVRFKISKKLWDSLPQKFVIKPTNSSGMNIIIEDKEKYNLQVINRVIGYLKNVHYGVYKNEPVYAFWNDFLITEYISDITDYKFFCFNGKVEFVTVLNEMQRVNDKGEPYQTIVDKNFNELPFSYGYERGEVEYQKPSRFDEMINIAEKLSQKFKHVRIDIMGNDDKIFFGEFTFFSGGGKDRFSPENYDLYYGDLIK